MKTLVRPATWLLLLGPMVAVAPPAFTSLYIFGDGVCTTTNGPGGTYYHGKRYTNGRVWVEVLAERQGLTYDANKNWSYFGHDSTNLLRNVASSAPPDAPTALFVIWCIDADFVWNANNSGTNLLTWTNALNQALTNHLKAVTNLYVKGARTLIMPNAVDITKVPYYVYYDPAKRAFIRQRAIEFNARFAGALSNTTAALPGLRIHTPDIFTLLDHLLAHPADYCVTNALDANGRSIDALADPSLANKSLNGPGADYVFWDNLDPTAKVHVVLADAAQRLVLPAQISQITPLTGSTRLEVVNLPIGRNGFVEASVSFAAWTSVTNIVSSNATQTVSVPAAAPSQFYRLRFPFAWTWP